MYLGCSVYNCGCPIPVSMLRVNTRVETQGDRTGGEERLSIRQEPSNTLKDALKRRGPAGVGHFIDHSCCPLHTNAELAVRWTSDAKDTAVAIVAAKRQILAGEWVWVNYATEDQTLADWAKRFSCICCQFRGACGDVQKLGINHLITDISDSSATGTPWGRSWKPTWKQEAMGLRVRVKLPHGSLEGNIIQVGGGSGASARGKRVESVPIITVRGPSAILRHLPQTACAQTRVGPNH